MRSHAKAPSAGSIWIAGATALILALAFLAISSSPAFAAVGQSVIRTFSTGPGQPQRVATDEAGNVYVSKPAVGRVEKFDSAGSPVPFAASAPYIYGNKLLGTPNGPLFDSGSLGAIAIDTSGGPNDGHIYLANGDAFTGLGSVAVFDAGGAYLGQLGQNKPARCAVAVNPSNGSLYMSTWIDFQNPDAGGPNHLSAGAVEHYATPEGVTEAADPTEELVTAATNKAPRCNILTDASGAVFLTDLNGNVVKYAASQFGVASPSPAVVFGAGGALALDPSNGDLYAGDSGQILKWNASGTPQNAPVHAIAEPSGLAVDSARHLVATEPGGGVFVFGPDAVQLPTGTTGGASNVTSTSADVEGSADPDGAGTITACEFRYGEDTGYADGSIPCAPGAPLSAPTSVSAHITGLVSGIAYHYRLFLTNANGTQMSTGDQTLSTPTATEGVFTGGPSEVGKSGAVLNGGYVGDGQDVHYFFEWGRTDDYDHTTPIPPGGDAGTESGPQNVAPIQISGLEADTTYHYRLVVSTASGITRGQDEAFTTLPAVTALTTEAATGITGTSAQLHGSFEGDGSSETHYFFEWGTSKAYGSKTPVPPGNAVPASSGKVDLDPVTISGLEGASTYHFRIVASNATGTTTGADMSFNTAEAPVVSNLGTRNVTATSAELTGEINPRYGETTYRFEWGPTATYGSAIPVPAGNAGSGNSLISVSAQLEGLSPGSTYHFRLVATNEYGTTASSDQTFSFYPPACPNSQLRQETRSNDLPDCRAYELVTPSFAQGTTIIPAAGPTSGVATNPARLAYGANYGLFPETSGEGMNGMTDAYVSTRSDFGWSQRYVGFEGGRDIGHGVITGGTPGGVIFNPFTGVGPGDSMRGTQGTPNLDRVIIYNWGFPGQVDSHVPGSNAPYVWDSSNGHLLGRWPSNLAEVPNSEHFVGFPQASADFSHFVFSSNVPFAEGGEASEGQIECCPLSSSIERAWPKASIYDNDLQTGAVVLASRRSDDTPFQGRVFDVSDDGSHILMGENVNFNHASASAPVIPKEYFPGTVIQGPLYLRVDDQRTYEIAPGRKLEYLASTADGATVYLASNERLTGDDHDQSRDLFAWHQSDPDSLTRVSFGDHGSAGNTDACTPNEQWTVACGVTTVRFTANRKINGEGGNGHSDNYLASKSGDVYFESPEQLVGAKGEAGERNLYLYRGGTVRYVATMSPSRRVARMQVTPDGRYMALITANNLTAYDSGGHLEMYLYDAVGGHVACASCRPDGLQPISEVLGSQNGLFLTNDGRPFFSTKDALQPRDTNQTDDVYEFTEGKAQLITTGIGTSLDIAVALAVPGLVGVSANGTDVYFGTIDHLVTQDHNGAQLKIYDARTGGGFPAEREEPKCLAADECHGPSSTPPASPPDRTSAGLGTPRKAKAHKAKKHKKAHKRHKHKKKHAGKAKRKSGGAKQGGKRHG